jgi:hypothetical protein
MYASMDFRSKRDFCRAVKQGLPIVVYSPELGTPAINGRETVTGPWQPPMWHGKQKEWVAHVEVRDMRIVAVH